MTTPQLCNKFVEEGCEQFQNCCDNGVCRFNDDGSPKLALNESLIEKAFRYFMNNLATASDSCLDFNFDKGCDQYEIYTSLDEYRKAFIDTIAFMGDARMATEGQDVGTALPSSSESPVFCDRCAEEIIAANGGQSESSVMGKCALKSPQGEPPANTSEISEGAERLPDVVDEYLHWRKVNPHIKGGENYLKRLRAATTEPVSGSVSLEKCAKAIYSEIDHGGWWTQISTMARDDYRKKAKAVLDTAGVKCVD